MKKITNRLKRSIKKLAKQTGWIRMQCRKESKEDSEDGAILDIVFLHLPVSVYAPAARYVHNKLDYL